MHQASFEIRPFNALTKEEIHLYKESTRTSYPDFINYSAAISNYWEKMERYFPEWQLFFFLENTLIGCMNTIPINYSSSLEDLPQEGWDWLLEKGTRDYEAGKNPTCLGGIQINVLKPFRGNGYSKQILKAGKEKFSLSRLDYFILPIRPTRKHLYPKLSMQEYLSWKVDDKLFDPWIRTHMNAGAQLLHVCSRSMQVSGDVKFWEQRLQKEITTSRYIHFPGAINSIHVNLEKDIGIYEEDNIWIYYKR